MFGNASYMDMVNLLLLLLFLYTGIFQMFFFYKPDLVLEVVLLPKHLCKL